MKNDIAFLRALSLLVSVCFVLLFTSTISKAQNDSVPVRSFRYFNSPDRRFLFIENEACPLPSKEDSVFSLTITVTNIRNNNGVIRFKFYDDSLPFPDDKGFLRIVFQKADIKCNTLVVTFHGFASRYMGIALHDDENGNKKLDFHWLLPAEGYAFSDYFHTSFHRPNYSNFRFLLKEDKSVIMKMRYH